MHDLINKELEKSSILIVDDDPGIRLLFEKAMKTAGFECKTTDSGCKALDVMSHTYFDVVVSDIDMPGMSGIELSGKIFEKYSSDVIIMTGKVKSYHYHEMINIGASDFVEKPFSIQELILRVNRVLRERRLKKEARNSHEELKQAYVDSIHRLVMASEFKDEDTGDHIVRIGEYSRLMARKLGLPDKEIDNIYYAAPMHDVGKIGIPDKIMLKPGNLTPEEFEIIKTHTTIGAKLLSRSKSGILKMAKDIALCHHEKYDGNGYPNQVSKEDIPVSCKIVAIADTFDALTSKRPYKDPYPPEMALDIIRNEKGRHFDPGITEIFMEYFSDFLQIRETIGTFEEVNLENFMLSARDKELFKA
ncbi:MAG: response regulator [Deltaproteobacteria bacterium]|nr:response regulator [Deltaproteobacteria bacterium]